MLTIGFRFVAIGSVVTVLVSVLRLLIGGFFFGHRQSSDFIGGSFSFATLFALNFFGNIASVCVFF
jgi:hypothetical protein